MSIAEHIQAEFTKPANLDEELSKLIDASKLDLSQNIPDPQMLVSKGDLPVCTRGNFSFVITQVISGTFFIIVIYLFLLL